MSVMIEAEATEISKLRKRLERERLARLQTEQIAEQGMHALYQRQADLQLLRFIAVAANEARSIRGVMQASLDQICSYSGWPIGHAWILAGPGTHELKSLGIWHVRGDDAYTSFRTASESMRMSVGVGLPGRVLASGKPAWVTDVSQDDNFPRLKLARQAGIQAGFAFPVLVGSRVAGVLEFFSLLPTPPDETMLELMAHVGTQLGLVIERKQAEDQIREQAELLDKARDAILMVNLQGDILYWNHGAERMYGWTQGEALGKSAFELLHAENNQPEHETARRECLSSEEWSGELRHVNKHGKEMVVESRWTLVREADGRPKGKLLINTDVTIRKKLEAQLQRTQRLESLGTLAGGIAHDLNNVLTPIMMGCDLVRPHVSDPSCRSILATMEINARRGSEMIKQVLAFARGTDGVRQHLQVAPLISELGKLLRQTFPRSLEVRLSVPKDLVTILGDPTQLHQVLMNLCVNARDAMPQGGRLTISARNLVVDENYARMHLDARPGPYVAITVEDTGAGIPPGIIDQIFDPFYTTKDFGKGTGMGLSNALGIIKNYQGFINVYSEVGTGSSFTVYLPAIEGAVIESHEQKRQTKLPGDGEMILVVDDEAAIRDITKTTIEEAGYRVLTAEDGATALAQFALHRGEIRVVLTDMMMPIMDGPATIRALHKMDPGVRIIAASGYNGTHGSDEWQAVVKATLSKPYTADTVLSALRHALQG